MTAPCHSLDSDLVSQITFFNAIERAEQFLVRAMRFSEALDPEADWFQPDLTPVEYDDDAFREILSEMRWDEGDCEVG